MHCWFLLLGESILWGKFSFLGELHVCGRLGFVGNQHRLECCPRYAQALCASGTVVVIFGLGSWSDDFTLQCQTQGSLSKQWYFRYSNCME